MLQVSIAVPCPLCQDVHTSYTRRKSQINVSLISFPYHVADPVVEDALQYPFIAALVSPFGPQAIQPFEGHLSLLHQYYGHESGGSWFKVPKRDSNRSSAEDREFLCLNLITYDFAVLKAVPFDLWSLAVSSYIKNPAMTIKHCLILMTKYCSQNSHSSQATHWVWIISDLLLFAWQCFYFSWLEPFQR